MRTSVVCVLVWLLSASSWLLWHPSVRLATWFWPSYNGSHYSNSCCRQHFTSVAFVWNVHLRDQYGGGIYNSIAGDRRFHLCASRLQLYQYSPALANSHVCLQQQTGKWSDVLVSSDIEINAKVLALANHMASFLGPNNVDCDSNRTVMYLALHRWPLAAKPQGPSQDSPCTHVGFVMDKVTVGQVSSEYLTFSPTVLFHKCSIFINLSPMWYKLSNCQWPMTLTRSHYELRVTN